MAGRTAGGSTTRHIVVARLMRISLWPTDITEAPAATLCRKDRRRPGRIRVISEEANSEAETRRVTHAPRIPTAAQQVEAVTASGTARFQAKAGVAGAVALFLVLPAGNQPVPAVPEALQAWDPVEAAAFAVVGGAGELALSISREQESNTGAGR